MQDALMSYFNAEKNAGLLIAFIGVVALGLAVIFFQLHHRQLLEERYGLEERLSSA